jgi:hypothetical protein
MQCSALDWIGSDCSAVHCSALATDRTRESCAALK